MLADLAAQSRLLVQNLQFSRVEQQALTDSIHRLRLDLEVSGPVRFLLGLQSVIMILAVMLAWWHGKL